MTVFASPAVSIDPVYEMLSDIHTFVSEYTSRNIVLEGDLNARIGRNLSPINVPDYRDANLNDDRLSYETFVSNRG